MNTGTRVSIKNTDLVGTIVSINGSWTKVQLEDGTVKAFRNGQVEVAPEPVVEPEVARPNFKVARPQGRNSRVRTRQPESTEPMPECRCGCGMEVLKRNRSYRQGHDQRHRGILLRELAATDDVEQSEGIIAELQRHWDYSRAELQEKRTTINAMDPEAE